MKMVMVIMTSTTNIRHSEYLVAVCLVLSAAAFAAAVAYARTTTASAIVVTSVPGTAFVTKGTSKLAEDVAAASVAHGRLPARVPLTVSLSAACSKRNVYISFNRKTMKSLVY